MKEILTKENIKIGLIIADHENEVGKIISTSGKKFEVSYFKRTYPLTVNYNAASIFKRGSFSVLSCLTCLKENCPTMRMP